MPIGAIGGAISGVGSLIGGILGNNAAGNAAQAEQAALGQAEAYQKQQASNATLSQQQATEQITANQQPFVGAGQGAVLSLQDLLAPGGQLSNTSYPGFTAPTAAQAQATPGYQFSLQQGENALQNSAAARGGLLSTGTAKNLTNYAEGAADTNYQNVYNNALQTYGTNFNVSNTLNNNLYSRLMGLTNTGESAAGSLNNSLQSGANTLANIALTSGQQVGNDITQAGQAGAAGIVGGTNALTAGIGGALNTVGQGITLQQLLGAQNASTSAPMAGVNPGSLSYSNNIGPSAVPPQGGLPVYTRTY